jgi:hypothetical protein
MNTILRYFKCSINEIWYSLWTPMHGHKIKFWSIQMYIIHTCKYLTNSMKQSPSSEANSCSVSQEISLILRKLMFPTIFTTAYHNSVCTPVSYFFQIQFNIALLSVSTHTHTHTYTHSLIHSLADKHTHTHTQTQHDYFRSLFLKENSAKKKLVKKVKYHAKFS